MYGAYGSIVTEVEKNEKGRAIIGFYANSIGSIYHLASIEDTKDHERDKHYFEIINVEKVQDGPLKGLLHVKAKEIGYWIQRFDNNYIQFNPAAMDLIEALNLKVTMITDKDKIVEIIKKDSYH